jgi:DUF4097 and DUF4098 domain-containing protein YvlB
VTSNALASFYHAMPTARKTSSKSLMSAGSGASTDTDAPVDGCANDSRWACSAWRSRSGSLSVTGVKGEIDAHAQSGDVEIRDAGDDIEVESLSGNVTIEGARGAVNVHTVSGDISLTGGRGDVEIETVSGEMELRDVASKQVRTNSTSGDLTFAGAILDDGRYQFQTHSGELRLELPANVGAQLSLSTFSGEIDSAFPITLTPGAHGIGASQAKKLTFNLGQGSARIIAETFSGDVTLTSTGRRP